MITMGDANLLSVASWEEKAGTWHKTPSWSHSKFGDMGQTSPDHYINSIILICPTFNLDFSHFDYFFM